METNVEFFHVARERFPDLAEKADRQHIMQWGEPPTGHDDSYIWFESVSNALNNEMQRSSYLKEAQQFFEFVDSMYRRGSSAVKNCIDVALVENLFWQVPSQKVAPYWQVLPRALQALYVDFHGRTPL